MEAPVFSFDMSYCGAPPTLGELWGRWNLDPALLIGLLAVALFAGFALRSASRGRQASFAGGWLLAAVLFVSPLCALTVALFSARVGHHIFLTMIVAPLLAFALPPDWGKRLPIGPALALSTIALWLWHSPDLYASAFAHPAIYWAMQITLLTSFTWLWLGLLRSDAVLGASVAALSSAIQMGLLGALLVFAPQPLYLPHVASTAAFGLLPLEDQQLAGIFMWVPANLPLMAVLLWRLLAIISPARGKPAQ
jgi:putative membrane protein